MAYSVPALDAFTAQFDSFGHMDILLVGGVLIAALTFLSLLVLTTSAYRKRRKQRNWDEEEYEIGSQATAPMKAPQRIGLKAVETKTAESVDETLIKKLEKGFLSGEAESPKPEKESFLNWLAKRRKYVKERLAQLEEKQFSKGLAPEEETQKRIHEKELEIVEEELLKNEAFHWMLRKNVEWAIEQAKNGMPSEEIRKKFAADGFSEREINIIRKVFKARREQLTSFAEEQEKQ